MTQFLLFRVYGPLVSWGDIAVGERRPTADRPSRSAILGLVAGALGIERSDHEMLTALRGGVGMACCVEIPGRLLHDYHTAQAPKEACTKEQEKRWKGKVRADGPLWTRAEELSPARDELSTILSERAYLADTLAIVALWLRNQDAPMTLTDLAQALRRPVFVPYLGRKSCPPALPFAPRIVDADHPISALQQADFAGDEAKALQPVLRAREWPGKVLRTPFEPPVPRQFAWEGQWQAQPELAETMSVQRRDEPGQRAAWQFHTRVEQVAHEGGAQETNHG